MTDLVLCVGTGKGTWTEAAQLVTSTEWQKVYVVTNAFGKEKFSMPANGVSIVVNEENSVQNMMEQIRKELEGKIQDLEVAVSIISGSGKMHTAMMGALLKVGLGIRLVTVTEKGMETV